MTPLRIAIVLTVLATVVVVLTRIRLQREGAGRLSISNGLLNIHTVAGVVAIGSWSYYLYKGTSMVGLGALVFWWVTTAAGLLILLRWMPARGRHSSGPTADTWGEGPGLSVLAHVGMLIGVLMFTGLFFLGKV